MWCPECRSEYRPQVNECGDCLVPLVEDLPPQPDHTLAEWELPEWDGRQLRSLFAALNGQGIRYEWDKLSGTLRVNRDDETSVDELLELIDDDDRLAGTIVVDDG